MRKVKLRMRLRNMGIKVKEIENDRNKSNESAAMICLNKRNESARYESDSGISEREWESFGVEIFLMIVFSLKGL